MSSTRKVESARVNGAKSHGPVTPEGKKRSSQNSLKHGLTADTLLVGNEHREAFEEMLSGLETEFQPATETENHLVRELMATQWRQYRCWAIETCSFDIQLNAQEKEILARFSKIDQPSRLALAFQKMAEAKFFNTLIRYETALRRQYHKTLAVLKATQKQRKAEPESVPEESASPTPFLQNEPSPNFEQPSVSLTPQPKDDN